MSAIEFGTPVRLHSGGTIMTVIGVGKGGVHCEWHDGDGALLHGTFAADELVELEPDAGAESAAGASTAAEKFVRELLPGLRRLFKGT